MLPLRHGPRGPEPGERRGLAWLVLAGSLVACQPVDQPGLAECGNGIVEPGASEDCEPVGDPAGCGAVGSGVSACRFICTEQACPEGYRCGLDAICRRACLGTSTCSAFEQLSSDITNAPIADVALVNVAGDGRPEILTVEAWPDSPALARVTAVDDDQVVAGAPSPVGEFPGLSTLGPAGSHYLLAQRGALPVAPASASASERQAIVSRLQPDLSFVEVLMQGPTVVEPGPLRLASFGPPADAPAMPLLFGFRDGAVWEPEPSGLSLPAAGHPDDLLGPVFGWPVDTAQAQAQGHLASAACPVMLYGFAQAALPVARNLCEGADEGWTTVPLTLPSLPDGATLGDGMVLGDANADGLDDLVVTTDAGRIHVAYAVGDGTFHSDAQALPPEVGDGQFDAGVGPSSDPGVSLGVIAVGDYGGDGRPDFITRSTWIRSCSLPGCGTCDVPGYRCDVGPGAAPGYVATAASVVDRDGDGDMELAVLARAADDPFFAAGQWGGVPPAPGDLVIIDDPGAEGWSARVVPLSGSPSLLTRGDLDGDRRDEVVLVQQREPGDELLVVYGADDSVERIDDMPRVVDAHAWDGQQTLAVVSEDLAGENRRLTLLSADHQRRLRSIAKLEAGVVPRHFVTGRFVPGEPGEVGLAVLGESPAGEVAVELLTRGSDTLFDGSTRRAVTTSLMMEPQHAGEVQAVAVDLSDDDLDELVVFAPDGAIRTLRVVEGPDGPGFEQTAVEPVSEPYRGPRWPGDGDPVSRPQARDLDGDGDRDLWTLTAEQPPRLVAFENLGDGTLAVADRVVSPHPPVELSVCEDEDCTVRVRAFAAFSGPTERSASVSPAALDVLLVSRRALFLWTLDPLDPTTADALPLLELAVVRGGRLPLSPPDGPVFGLVGDIDGDGIDDVIAGGLNGIRWLEGLAVIP